MALKPDRDYNEVTDITRFWVASESLNIEKGGIASVVTAGSGAAMGEDIDKHPNTVSYNASGVSGVVPVGVLLVDVNQPLSETRDFRDYDSLEARPGEKVPLLRKGFVVTDMILGTPVAGDTAYLAPSGKITSSQDHTAVSGVTDASGIVTVGRFETSKDAGGFARIYIDI